MNSPRLTIGIVLLALSMASDTDGQDRSSEVASRSQIISRSHTASVAGDQASTPGEASHSVVDKPPGRRFQVRREIGPGDHCRRYPLPRSR